MAHDTFRTLLVANPQSANGSLGRKWSALEAIISRQFGAFDHRFTEQPGDASVISRTALQQGYEMVVAMGGDGTISEVVNGFFVEGKAISSEAVLGVLPYGTGGDFRKAIGAPKKLRLGAASLIGRETRRIDVGRLTYTKPDGQPALYHFINIASFGIGGLVDKLVNESSKAFGGRLSFAMATLRAFRRYRPQRARVRLDAGDPREVTLQNIAVANGQFFGGGMHIAPRASIDDGLFDVVTLGPQTFSDLLLRGHKVYRGTHLDLPGVTWERARRVEAEAVDPEEAILLDVDGETPGRLPATFEILPAAIRLKVPVVAERASRNRP